MGRACSWARAIAITGRGGWGRPERGRSFSPHRHRPAQSPPSGCPDFPSCSVPRRLCAVGLPPARHSRPDRQRPSSDGPSQLPALRLPAPPLVPSANDSRSWCHGTRGLRLTWVHIPAPLTSLRPRARHLTSPLPKTSTHLEGRRKTLQVAVRTVPGTQAALSGDRAVRLLPLLSGGQFQVPQIAGPVCQAPAGRLPDRLGLRETRRQGWGHCSGGTSQQGPAGRGVGGRGGVAPTFPQSSSGERLLSAQAHLTPCTPQLRVTGLNQAVLHCRGQGSQHQTQQAPEQRETAGSRTGGTPSGFGLLKGRDENQLNFSLPAHCSVLGTRLLNRTETCWEF